MTWSVSARHTRMGTGGGSPEFVAFFYLGMVHTCYHGSGDETRRHRELTSQPA